MEAVTPHAFLPLYFSLSLEVARCKQETLGLGSIGMKADFWNEVIVDSHSNLDFGGQFSFQNLHSIFADK